jgi:hypothetical protein
MVSGPLERVSPRYCGKPFSATFQAMKGEEAYWRIKGSGVRWVPESCRQTKAVFEARRAYVDGAKAVILIALHLGLKVREAWRRKHGLEGVGMNELLAGLNQQDTLEHA